MPPCDVCAKMKKNIENGTPCETCIPELMPGNVQALEIYNLVQTQLILAPSGKAVDIDLSALDRILRRYEIKGTKVFEKVVAVARHMIKENNGS